MPPPATFYTITTFPYSQAVVQADFNGGTHSGGVANEVWFKYVLTSEQAIGFYSTIGGTFNYRVDFFESDSLTDRGHNIHKAGWFLASTHTNYWIRVRRDPAGASNFDFTVHLDSASTSPTITPGDYLINDDDDFAGSVISPAGVFRGFSNSVPGGEMVAGLPSGHVLVHDRFGKYSSKIALLDPTLTLISSFDLPTTIGSGFPNISENRGMFYVGHPSVRNVYSVDTSGTPTLVASSIPGTGRFNTIGVNPGATIVYYVDNTDPSKIKRYNLSTSSVMSYLYDVGGSAVVGLTAINGHPGDLVVLSDGSVVTYYQDTGVSVLIHVSASGSLLHSYSVSTASQSYDHVSRAPDDPVSVNVWSFLATDDTGRFDHMNISTGSADVTFDQELFSAGENRTANTTIMFGPSSSCGFTTLLGAEASTGYSPQIPQANSSECCASSELGAVEGGGNPPPGAGVEHPVLLSAAWTGRCEGGGVVPLLPDLTDAENWSDS